MKRRLRRRRGLFHGVRLRRARGRRRRKHISRGGYRF